MSKSIEDYDNEIKDICNQIFEENADLGISLQKVMSRDIFVKVVSELVLRNLPITK